MSNFSGHPPTIGEIRSGRSQSASDWTPRDVLIRVLRDLDQGRIAPEVLLVAWADPSKDGTRRTDWYVSSPDVLVTAGLVHRVSAHVVTDA